MATINGTVNGETLSGTSLADTISGRGGNDFIYGYGGDDVIYAHTAGYTSYYNGNAKIWGGDGGDTIYLGNSSTTNYAYGEQGNDYIYGKGANDVIDGGSGNDYIEGGGGADSLSGGTGADTIKMGYGSSTAASLIDGGYDNDELYLGYSGNLTANGGQGDDKFYVSQPCWGGTTFDGGTESDSVIATQNNFYIGIKSITGVETITAGAYSGVKIYGYAGSAPLDLTSTSLVGIAEIKGWSADNNIIHLAGKNATDTGAASADLVNAGDGADTIYGGFANDILNGESGNDALYGDQDNDTLSGGAGTDSLAGGSGADTFVFRLGFESDTVFDFSTLTSGERVQIGGYSGIDDFSDLAGLTSQTGSDTTIDFGSGDMITLLGVAAADLTASHFDFLV